jgi:uncharacterized protein
MPTIQERLDTDLKNGMRAKDADRVACIRQVRAKAQATTNEADFKGPTDDAFYMKVISGYIKSLEKGITELAVGGDKSLPLRKKYEAEIAYLSQYLPRRMSEPETRILVQEAIGKLSATSTKDTGKVMGAIMKDHKDSVDATLVKQLINELLPKA